MRSQKPFVGPFTNPDTGLTATYIGHDKVLNDLDVPGDQATGRTLIVGPSM